MNKGLLMVLGLVALLLAGCAGTMDENSNNDARTSREKSSMYAR